MAKRKPTFHTRESGYFLHAKGCVKDPAYLKVSSVMDQVIMIDDYIYLVIYDHTAGKRDRYTVKKVPRHSMKRTVIIGRELPQEACRRVIEKDSGVTFQISPSFGYARRLRVLDL